MTSQPGKETIAIHIMCNISRIKDNQTMKFDQLMEYNMRNTFLEKSYRKCGGETILRPFFKNPKLSISLDLQSTFIPYVSLYAKVRTIEIQLLLLPKAF